MGQTEVGRYNDFLKSLFSMQGQIGAPGVSSELIPTVVTEPGNASHAYLRRERLRACTVTVVAGGAGTYSTVRLHNPLNSNHNVVLSQLSHQTSGATAVLLGWLKPIAPLASAVTVFPRDTRQGDMTPTPPVTAGVGGVTYGTPASSPANGWWRSNSPANTQVNLSLPIVISPGNQLVVGCSVVNLTLLVSFAWTEIPTTQLEE